jgi:GNAT superfamily N-acetyltransferase
MVRPSSLPFPVSLHPFLVPSLRSSSLRTNPQRRYAPLSKLGRFAILKPHRGTGAGSILGAALEEHIASRRGRAAERFKGEEGEAELVANSQMIAIGYYLKRGWEAVGPEFLEVRIFFPLSFFLSVLLLDAGEATLT